MTLTRRAALALPLALATGSSRAAVPPADVTRRVETYLNGLTTVRARFSQLNPDGSSAHGQLYIERGRGMRFDYDPPSKILLVATDWRLIFSDASTKQINVIPLSETPLGVLLDESVSLTGETTVTEADARGGEVHLGVVRTKAPDQGKVTMTFAERPMELRRWTVIDAQGLATQVLLEGLETGIALDPGLFVWRDPKMFGWPKD